jgi:hypothetical protein
MAKCTITPTDNGPYEIDGEFVIKDPDGKAFDLGGHILSGCAAAANRKTNPAAMILINPSDSRPRLSPGRCHRRKKADQYSG